MAQNENHWWESYLVRYLVGNIVAVIVLFYLFINYDNEIGKQFCKYDNNTNFCNQIENNKTTFSTEVFGFIFQNTKEINTTTPIHLNKEMILPEKLKINTTDISFVALIIMGLLGFAYMYIASIPIYFIHIIRGGLGNSFEFYKKSSEIRDKIEKKDYICNQNLTPEYIKSYKHMREHGNAHGIILMEILFAGFIIQCNFSIFALVFWLLFGFFGWFLGIYLEMEMVYKDYKGRWFLLLPFYLIILFPFALWLASYGCNL